MPYLIKISRNPILWICLYLTGCSVAMTPKPDTAQLIVPQGKPIWARNLRKLENWPFAIEQNGKLVEVRATFDIGNAAQLGAEGIK